MQSSEERTWVLFLHLSGLLGSFFLGLGCIIIPLILWLLKREESQFVNDQGKEVLNFQITVILTQIIAVIAMVFFWIVGFVIWPLLILGGIMFLIELGLILYAIICPILGAIKSNEGVYYRYPYCLRLIP